MSQSIHEEPAQEHYARDSIYEAEGENSSTGMRNSQERVTAPPMGQSISNDALIGGTSINHIDEAEQMAAADKKIGSRNKQRDINAQGTQKALIQGALSPTGNPSSKMMSQATLITEQASMQHLIGVNKSSANVSKKS